MKVLVFSKPEPGADRDRYIAEEGATIDRLHAESVIEQIYVRNDGVGAVTVVEASSPEEAVRLLHQLPLVANGCISIEAVPVTEFEFTRSAGSE